MTNFNDFLEEGHNHERDVNMEHPHQYHCECGCNLDFINYEAGFDIYVGNSWVVSNNAMVNYNWSNYIQMNEFKVWNELRECIVINYNQSLMHNEQVKPENAPWIHLFNLYGNSDIPLNEKLYYEYII